LKEGDTFTFTTEQIVGDETRVAVNYPDLIDELKVGDQILVNNGLVVCEVKELKGSDAICTVLSGGELSNNKSMNFPNKVLKGDYLSAQDKEDLLFGIKNGVDFVAASFVSNGSDMRALKSFLTENGGGDIDIIAKIENQSGVDHISEICELADGIMIARGDLGVEIPYVELPAIQKRLTKTCRLLGKRVITATEMLESMIHNPRPTRAEISDVANAVYDGSSAVMLSGESAAGKYPVLSVKTMAEIAECTEREIDYTDWFHKTEYVIHNNLDALSHGTCAMAIDVNAKCIVVNSVSGTTARMVSRFRCPVDIVGMTTSKKAWRKLNLSWGVYPMLSEQFNSIDVMFYNDLNQAKEVFGLKKGDNVVLTGGQINGTSGNTNMIKVETI
jgi:pyruvate kinase